MRYWLMKSEPFKYSWDDLVSEGEGTWDGVRNHRAKNNLAAMEVGDQAFFYHSREGLEIVGICEVSVAGITDPTDPEGMAAEYQAWRVRAELEEAIATLERTRHAFRSRQLADLRYRLQGLLRSLSE